MESLSPSILTRGRPLRKVYVIDAIHALHQLWPVRKRVAGVQYFLEHHNGFFYILTNAPLENTTAAAEGYYLARCRAEKSLLANWQVIIIPRPDMTFQDMDIFQGHLVLSIQKEGLPLFCSIDLPFDINVEQPIRVDDLQPWFFPVPTHLSSIVPASNHDFESAIYRVVISSPVMPDVIVDYDMKKRTFSIVHQEEVVGLSEKASGACVAGSAYDLIGSKPNRHEYLQDEQDLLGWTDLSEAFCCERREVVSHDGFTVPLTLVYSREIQINSGSHGLLHGYGAYGEVLDKSWNSDNISLLSRGWILAYADVRGGGEGSSHRSGAGKLKMNSIYDFTACGMYLVQEGFVHKNRLAAIGSSAGGLLVAAVMNNYPSLFSVAILKVPFLDICNTMLDPSLPLTSLDYDEFGDPRKEADFTIMSSYSPYNNITPQTCYPSVLVTASFHDSRVGVWEAAKWVAQVRERTCSTCSKSVILKTNMGGGHFGEGGRFSHCEDAAFEHAFLIKTMEMLDS